VGNEFANQKTCDQGILLVLRVPMVREEMRLPERKKPFSDFSGASNEHLESTSSFFTLPTTLLATLCE
jgi:hypothetical protein